MPSRLNNRDKLQAPKRSRKNNAHFALCPNYTKLKRSRNYPAPGGIRSAINFLVASLQKIESHENASVCFVMIWTFTADAGSPFFQAIAL